MKSKKKSVFHYVTVKLSVVTSNCEVHLLSVSQPASHLSDFKKGFWSVCPLFWSACGPSPILHNWIVVPQQHLLSRRHSCAKRAPSAVAKQQYWLSVECKYCLRQLCDKLSCFLDLKMNLHHPRDGDTKAHDTTVALSVKAWLWSIDVFHLVMK